LKLVKQLENVSTWKVFWGMQSEIDKMEG